MRNWRQSTVAKVLATGVLVLLVAEGALRVPAFAERLPAPTVFYAEGVQARIDRLDALNTDGRSPEILFVGNSVAATNISPTVIVAELGDGHDDLFVLGLPGLTIDPLRVQLERLWLTQVQPDVVIQVVRLFDFVDPVRAADDELFTQGRAESRWVTRSVRSEVELLLIERSALIRHAGVLAEAVVTGMPTRDDALSEFPLDAYGHQQRLGYVDDNVARHGLDGVHGGSTARNGYRTPVAEETYTRGLEMIRETMDLVQGSGATYVLLNMPEHPDKFLAAPDGAERYASYIEALQAFADSAAITLIDPSDGDLSEWSDNQLFFDFHHLNEDGAIRMSQSIAEMLKVAGVASE